MKTDYVLIDGQYYSPKHPFAKGKRGVPMTMQMVSDSMVELRTTPKRKGLNQTEQRYKHILEERFPFGHVQAHAIKLQLAEKCWYTPDFSYVLPTGALVFVETKGAFERDDAIVKLKTAARQFPQFTFIKAKYVDGKWTETVMPK